MTTTGGDKLMASIRAARAQPPVRMIEIGFKDRRISVLADQLEFGNPRTNLPERPAFRAGVRELEELIRTETRKWRSPGPTWEQAAALAIAGRDLIRESYRRFHGEPLSERQKARKEGTPFEEEELIGSEGPKLIAHIRAFVDGDEVG